MFARKLNFGTSLLCKSERNVNAHLRAKGEVCTMPEEPNPTDIVIQSVVATPTVVGVNQTFTISVTVFAPDEDFEDQVGFRLFCNVCPCGGDGPAAITPLSPVKGHVNETGQGWETPQSTFNFTVTAGATPSVYNITAVLLEGTKGVPDAGDPPSVFCTNCSGAVIVVDPR